MFEPDHTVSTGRHGLTQWSASASPSSRNHLGETRIRLGRISPIGRMK